MPVEAQNIPLEELFSRYANASTITESNKFSTVPTGNYQLQVTKAEGKAYPDRELAHFTANVMIEGKRKGTVFFDASWQEKRNAKGYLDTPSRLWGQLGKALNPGQTDQQIADINAGELMKQAQAYPVMAFITESFRVPSATSSTGFTWDSPKDEATIKAYREKAYEAKNFVQSISKMPA